MKDLPDTRTCRRCDTERPIGEFPLRRGRPCAVCRFCQPSYRRKEPWEGTKHAQHNRAWIRRNPEKRKAHKTVELAVRKGDLVKPKTCERCDKPPAGAHHEDYSRPLDVNWFCAKHHAERHKEMRREAAEVEALSDRCGNEPPQQARTAA